MTRQILVAFAIVMTAAAGSLTAQEIPRDGVTLPTVVRSVKPSYTAAAMDAGIEGRVLLDVVVLDDGKVGEVTVRESLDKEHGLDTQAVEAARQWLFKPGMKDGKPVPVRVELEMRFTLK
jgi:protein TonB